MCGFSIVLIFKGIRRFENQKIYVFCWTKSQSLINKHNQKPKDMFNKQDAAVYLTYIKILKYIKFLASHFRSHFQSIIKS